MHDGTSIFLYKQTYPMQLVGALDFGVMEASYQILPLELSSGKYIHFEHGLIPAPVKLHLIWDLCKPMPS
jgi:hypothetical protein